MDVRFKGFKELTTAVTLIITAAGVWATFDQIRHSSENFEKQLEAQRRETSVLIVSDFMNQIGALSISDRGDQLQFNKMLVSRAQLLLRTLEDEDLKAQILQYLGGAGFEHIFKTSPGSTAPTISTKGITFDKGVFSGISLSDSLLNCTSFKNAVFEFSNFNNSTIIRTNFANAHFQVAPNQFDDANIQWTNMQNVELSGTLEPWKASIRYSNLRGLKIEKDTLKRRLLLAGEDANRQQDEPYALTKADINDQLLQERNSYEIARFLSSAKSLFGSVVDENVEERLKRLPRYEQLRPEVNVAGTHQIDNNRTWEYETIRQEFCDAS